MQFTFDSALFSSHFNGIWYISSHSLRKTFGRRVYETFGETEKALVMLSKIYNHSSVGITRTYLDITQEEIEDLLQDCMFS